MYGEENYIERTLTRLPIRGLSLRETLQSEPMFNLRPNTTNGHPWCAARRTAAQNLIETVIQTHGLEPYSISSSIKDVDRATPGCREFFCIKDALYFHQPFEDEIPGNAAFMMIDVDYHLNDAQFTKLLFQERPIMMYTFTPTAPGFRSDEASVVWSEEHHGFITRAPDSSPFCDSFVNYYGDQIVAIDDSFHWRDAAHSCKKALLHYSLFLLCMVETLVLRTVFPCNLPTVETVKAPLWVTMNDFDCCLEQEVKGTAPLTLTEFLKLAQDSLKARHSVNGRKPLIAGGLVVAAAVVSKKSPKAGLVIATSLLGVLASYAPKTAFVASTALLSFKFLYAGYRNLSHIIYKIDGRYVGESRSVVCLEPRAKGGFWSTLVSYNSLRKWTRKHLVPSKLKHDDGRTTYSVSSLYPGTAHGEIIKVCLEGSDVSYTSTQTQRDLAGLMNDDSKAPLPGAYEVNLARAKEDKDIDTGEPQSVIHGMVMLKHFKKVDKSPLAATFVQMDPEENLRGPVLYRNNPAPYTRRNEGKISMRAVVSEFLPGHAMLQVECASNEEDCMRRRLECVRAKGVKYTPKLSKRFNEFCNLLFPNPQLLRLEDTAEVYANQKKPTQRNLLDKAFRTLDPFNPPDASSFMNRIKSFMKKEIGGKAGPARNISPSAPEARAMCSLIAYALSKFVKKQSWYAFGQDPSKIAQRVMEICSQHGIPSADQLDLKNLSGSGTDFSKMDGTVNPVTRALDKAILYHAFCSGDHWLAQGFYDCVYGSMIKGKYGTKSSQGASQASGDPFTSILNTIRNAFCVWNALRNQGLSKQQAWSSLGIYGGDDGLTINLQKHFFEMSCAELGFVATLDIFKPLAEDCKERTVTFLSRQYGPGVWLGDVENICDPPRTLRSMPFTGTNMAAESIIHLKYNSLLRADADTFLISTICKFVLSCSDIPTKLTAKDLKSLNGQKAVTWASRSQDLHGGVGYSFKRPDDRGDLTWNSRYPKMTAKQMWEVGKIWQRDIVLDPKNSPIGRKAVDHLFNFMEVHWGKPGFYKKMPPVSAALHIKDMKIVTPTMLSNGGAPHMLVKPSDLGTPVYEEKKRPASKNPQVEVNSNFGQYLADTGLPVDPLFAASLSGNPLPPVVLPAEIKDMWIKPQTLAAAHDRAHFPGVPMATNPVDGEFLRKLVAGMTDDNTVIHELCSGGFHDTKRLCKLPYYSYFANSYAEKALTNIVPEILDQHEELTGQQGYFFPLPPFESTGLLRLVDKERKVIFYFDPPWCTTKKWKKIAKPAEVSMANAVTTIYPEGIPVREKVYTSIDIISSHMRRIGKTNYSIILKQRTKHADVEFPLGGLKRSKHRFKMKWDDHIAPSGKYYFTVYTPRTLKK